MENIGTQEQNFYRSKQYGKMLLICLFFFLTYILFRFIYFNRIPVDLVILLILGIGVNWASWDSPIISITDSLFIFRNGIYRKRIVLSNIKSVTLKGNSYFWNMKIIFKYNEGNKEKQFVVWASMVEDYQHFYNYLSDKINKNNTVYPTSISSQ